MVCIKKVGEQHMVYKDMFTFGLLYDEATMKFVMLELADLVFI